MNILKNTEIRISQFIKHHTSTENIIALTKYLSGNNNRKLCSLINSITEENQGDVHDIINKKVDMEVLSKYMININTNKLEYIIRYETEKFSEIVSFSGGSETIQKISSEINNTEVHELHDKIDYIYRRFIDKLGPFEKLKERFGGKDK